MPPSPNDSRADRVITVRRPALLLLAAIALGMGGCAGSSARLYVNSEADMTFYKKVGVLPFENLTQERFAGDRLTRSFVTELIIADRFELVEPADFWTILEKAGATPGSAGNYDAKKLQQAAEGAGITGIIRGAVTEYEMHRNGGSESPALSFDVQMTDVATGKVVWRASIAKRGKGRVPVVGGGGERSLGRVGQQACRALVARLQKEAF
jgi:curli biogenesis system outer membrane secretion channel CsgG